MVWGLNEKTLDLQYTFMVSHELLASYLGQHCTGYVEWERLFLSCVFEKNKMRNLGQAWRCLWSHWSWVIKEHKHIRTIGIQKNDQYGLHQEFAFQEMAWVIINAYFSISEPFLVPRAGGSFFLWTLWPDDLFFFWYFILSILYFENRALYPSQYLSHGLCTQWIYSITRINELV